MAHCIVSYKGIYLCSVECNSCEEMYSVYMKVCTKLQIPFNSLNIPIQLMHNGVLLNSNSDGIIHLTNNDVLIIHTWKHDLFKLFDEIIQLNKIVPLQIQSHDDIYNINIIMRHFGNHYSLEYVTNMYMIHKDVVTTIQQISLMN